MTSGRRLALVAAGLLGLLAVSGSPVARGGEIFDSRTRDMLRRAQTGEKPTPEDQRLAARLLRDWDLSERTAPLNQPSHMRQLLHGIMSGEEPRASHLRTEAGEMIRTYMTPDGYARRMRYGPYGKAGRPAGGVGASAERGPPRTPDPVQYWFLFAACLLIMFGGIVVWVLSRRRNRPDYRIYYS